MDLLKQLIRQSKEANSILKYRFGEYYSPYYHLMGLLAACMAPCIAVELGVEKGRGIISLASGSDNCLVYGVDSQPTPEARELEKSLLNFGFIEATSVPVPERLLDKRIDILHIDTEHHCFWVQQEFDAYYHLMKPGSVVLFDDTHAAEDSVLNFILERNFGNLIIDDDLHPICGYAVVLL